MHLNHHRKRPFSLLPLILSALTLRLCLCSIVSLDMSYSVPPKDGREAAERLRATVKSGKPIIGSGAGIGL